MEITVQKSYSIHVGMVIAFYAVLRFFLYSVNIFRIHMQRFLIN